MKTKFELAVEAGKFPTLTMLRKKFGIQPTCYSNSGVNMNNNTSTMNYTLTCTPPEKITVNQIPPGTALSQDDLIMIARHEAEEHGEDNV